MRLVKIDIQNFRLLKDASIALGSEETVTILVGANNSGKTSAIDALRLLTEGASRKLELSDFSLATRKLFDAAQVAFLTPAVEGDTVETPAPPSLPLISMTLTFEYTDAPADLAAIGDLLMDLDPEAFQVAVQIQFGVKDVAKLQADFASSRRPDETLCDFLEGRLGSYFGLAYFKVEPKTGAREALPDRSAIDRLIKVDFVAAQRHMADEDSGQSTRLSSLLHGHYERRYKTAEPEGYKDLEATLQTHSKELSGKYMKAFDGLIQGLEQFGYPQDRTPKLSIKAQLKAETLFKDNTRVFYAAELEALAAGDPPSTYDLPEKYNGLGFKNLIYMILELKSFREQLEHSEDTRPRVHLILLEEPEVHLHPQVQSVFVREISKFLAAADGGDVQLLLTSHSSHIVAHSGFSPIRYFRRKSGAVEVKDLLRFDRAATTEEQRAALDFLRSYLTQTRCDLFFADKAILVEGQVERLLLPKMIEKCAVGEHANLATDYLSIMEVGGAYAHIFRALIEFLEVPTLIITDLDSVDAENKKCRPAVGVSTSNATLKKWLPGKQGLAEIQAATEAQKTDKNAQVAFQIPDSDQLPCGRSFEEAFVYANVDWLIANRDALLATGSSFAGLTGAELAAAAYDLSIHKTDFALDLMVKDDWATPKYIAEGLTWLASRGGL